MLKKCGVSAVFSVVVCLLLITQVIFSQPKLNKNNVKEVVAAMTLEEKAKLLVGMGMFFPGAPPLDPEDIKTPEKVPGAAGRTHAIPRLGIPSIVLSDGPAGVRINPTRPTDRRMYYATAFPVATLLASSWDLNLMRKVGSAFGNEAHEYGIDIILAPAMNIHRNPLGGRNFEYYSEDPLIAGKMAAAFVNGFQSQGVGTSIKHFAANNQEFNRMQSNTIVSQRALREIYLKGFEIAVKESSPWTVMSSYNLINGTYTAQNPELLTTILRKEWGYNGFVMTDWFAGNDIIAQMNAGNEVNMPGNPAYTNAIVEAVKNGKLDQKVLDKNVENVLKIIVQTPSFNNYKYTNQPDLKANAQVSREAAAEGMVLLKNENQTLPIKSGKKVSLFGNTSYELIAGGTGSGDVNKAYTVSIEEGLSKAGFEPNSELKSIYTKYVAEQKAKRPPTAPFMPKPMLKEMEADEKLITQQSNDSELAIITIGRDSGEFVDRKVENDFTLSTAEQKLIKEVTNIFHAKGKKVIVLLNIGGVIETASWKDIPDAILLAWQPGQEGGNAIADVLTGKVNPSGKLASTFPIKYEDVPSAKNFPGKELVGQKPLINSPLAGKPAEVVYEEGIFIGYRYYKTFNVKTSYEFGYGLSYSDFSYSDLKLSAKNFNKEITATVEITNIGKFAGKEAVQLYLSAPSASLPKPESELKAFAKTDLLQPGKSQVLTFKIKPENLASFDTTKSAWIAEKGNYQVKIGASSLNIKQTANFALKNDLVVEKVNNVLAPKVKLFQLLPKE